MIFHDRHVKLGNKQHVARPEAVPSVVPDAILI